VDALSGGDTRTGRELLTSTSEKRRRWDLLVGRGKALAVAAAAVAVMAAAGVRLRLVGVAEKPAWPPAVPLVRLTADSGEDRTRVVRPRAAWQQMLALSEILAERGESLPRAAMNRVLQSIIPAPAPTRLERRVTLAPGARLFFEYAILPEGWYGPAGRVRFAATVRTAKARRLAEWSDEIRTGPTLDRRWRRWRSAEIDLAGHAGERAVVELTTESLGVLPRRSAGDFAVWGNPVLVSGRDSGPPNIILVLIDALRADRLGCYGHTGGTSPNIDALAREGIRYASAFSQAPWTAPSVASLLTSKYPGEVRDREAMRLAPEAQTFVEVLSHHGYTCAAIVQSPIVSWREGFDRGFDYFDTHPSRAFTWDSEAKILTEEVTPWLRQNRARRFFLYLHYMDPHDPYSPPEEFQRRYTPAGYRSRLDGVDRGDMKVVEEELLSGAVDRLEESDLSYLRGLYDASIQYADSYLGRLVRELERLGLRENTAIIIAADHGEEFWDHGWIRHGRALYRESLHVPLIIVPPGGEEGGKVVNEPVGLIDIGPTVLDLAGVKGTFGRGESLLALAAGKSRGQPVFSELGAWITPPKPGQPRAHWKGRSLVSGKWHLILRADGQSELYNLARDPAERHDLAGVEAEQDRDMRRQLAQVLAERRGRGLAARQAAARTDLPVVPVRPEGSR
jgi:arylsulfatase A-like enzyme